MTVVVVESPAKAKTINKYLGPDFTVLASYGHVRDLPAKDGSVRPDEDFAMSWEVDSKSAKRMADIADALKDDDRLILATDPDREGEAIAWHLCEVLKLNPATTNRIVFHEITKSAIEEAVAHPRTVDMKLVEAQQARQILDRIVGTVVPSPAFHTQQIPRRRVEEPFVEFLAGRRLRIEQLPFEQRPFGGRDRRRHTDIGGRRIEVPGGEGSN